MQKGQSIIEIIIAFTILIIIVSSSVAAIVGSFTATRLAEEETQAALFVSEGLEAVQSIRNQSWFNLANGNYGLSFSGGAWAFDGSSDDPDSTGKFTRSITIADVQRDGNGDIVASGGTVDEDTKKVIAAVTWNFTPTRSNVVDMVAYLTNWQTARSQAGVGGGCTSQADCLVIDSAAAVASGQELQGITLGNSDPANSITIDRMTISWSGSLATQTIEIKINGVSVWVGTKNSGDPINITSVVLGVSSSDIPIDFIKFDAGIAGATVSITFRMSDSSTQTVSDISL